MTISPLIPAGGHIDLQLVSKSDRSSPARLGVPSPTTARWYPMWCAVAAQPILRDDRTLLSLEEPRMKRHAALLTALIVVALSLAAAPTPADASVIDGTCIASITLDFAPPATQPLPPNPAPAATATGTGTITTCLLPGGGATTGTFGYALAGNLTCTSAQNVTGTLDIAWSDTSHTHATVTSLLLSLGSIGGTAGLSATATSGRFAGDQILIANLRDPLALIACLTTGLAHATGTTSLTFTQPL